MDMANDNEEMDNEANVDQQRANLMEIERDLFGLILPLLQYQMMPVSINLYCINIGIV